MSPGFQPHLNKLKVLDAAWAGVAVFIFVLCVGNWGLDQTVLWAGCLPPVGPDMEPSDHWRSEAISGLWETPRKQGAVKVCDTIGHIRVAAHPGRLR